MENNLVDDMEEDYFSISNILQGLRLGKYREKLSTDLAYSFSGKITDFNAWTRALSSRDMMAWTNCQGNLNPDLGEIIYHLSFILYHLSFILYHLSQWTGRHSPGSCQVSLRLRIVWRGSAPPSPLVGFFNPTQLSSTAATTLATCSTRTWGSATPRRPTSS